MHKPTESEMEILQILWEEGPSTVRRVNELQNNMRKVGYTTTLKIMQLMVEKDLLDVDKTTRQHIYTAIPEQEKTRLNLLVSFLDKTFQGSASSLIMQLLGNKKTSKEELIQIKEYIHQLEKENE